MIMGHTRRNGTDVFPDSGLPAVISDGRVELVDVRTLPRKYRKKAVDPDEERIRGGLDVQGCAKGYDCSKIRKEIGEPDNE